MAIHLFPFLYTVTLSFIAAPPVLLAQVAVRAALMA
jgi:hypothetical protein